MGESQQLSRSQDLAGSAFLSFQPNLGRVFPRGLHMMVHRLPPSQW